MPPFLHRVKTASGATAVQIAEKQGRVNRILKYLGSAHDDVIPAVSLEKGRKELCPGQLEFDLFDTGSPGTSRAGGICRKTAVVLKCDPYYKHQRNLNLSQ